ncbi:MAG: tRNA (adenosine(37)-N6)-dimethylallyltransferase MiaA [Deltaproteobacteria bacterium]|nr:tRNA (adenosine(37)-N6)-dimethylallyltransferase MiaA [Deltaproteobacteria bacterium]MBW2415571.1 tRNA (adenosine(37)-N6)-dimethylallyltransferase MiaA [Deltaproteobacteria bacterium]
MSRPRVLALVGLTGTGKTALACAVARRAGAEVISADSMQVYRGMDIGTAKPSRALRGEVPHHAIDVVDPDDPMSAGRFAALAREAADDIVARGRRVIVCGGTGLYARAFAGGLIGGAESDPGLRAELEARDAADLYAELERRDPATARQTPPANKVRVVRALEALQLAGRPVSEQRESHGFSDRPYDVRWLALGLERDTLWRRIEARVERMFAAGLVDEVRGLHAAGYGPELRALKSIGYREVGELLAGRTGEAQARDAITLATRQYAKRQRTWFNAEPGLRWLDATAGAAVLEETALEALG